MADNETIADIIAEMRGFKCRNLETGELESCNAIANYFADRFDAAHKREVAVSKTETTTPVAVAENATTTQAQPEPLNMAKLREALAAYLALWDNGTMNNLDELKRVIKQMREALSAPPRNCDMPLVVDGPADNNADKAWLVFKRHNPDAYFDVPGLLRCIDWLLAPATEKEGGNYGNE